MNVKDKQLHDLLAQIAHLSSEAIQGGEHTGYETGEDGGTDQAPPDYEMGCTVKSLPKRLLVKAAQTAVKMNPANGVVFGPVGDVGAAMDVMEPQRIAVMVAKYWGPTPRRLTVSFTESTPADLRRRIVSHMNAWTRTACISFVETQGTGQVRISRGPGGYWSYLGTDILHIPQNRQTMNLQGFTMNTPESEYQRVVRHETGHTLGFPHEHMRRQLVNRLDPEKTYDYFWRTQRWDRATVKAQVLTPLDEASIRGTPNADQDSIMCYQLPASITRDGQPIRGGLDIDRLDYDFAGRIYPKRGHDVSVQRDTVGEVAEWEEAEDPLVTV
jgi:hypothetical protein